MKMKSLKKIMKRLKEEGLDHMVEGVEMRFNGFSLTLAEILEAESAETVIEMRSSVDDLSSTLMQTMMQNSGMFDGSQGIIMTSLAGDEINDPDDMYERFAEDGGLNKDYEPAYISRQNILDMASEAVTKDRQETHGAPEDSFKRVANLWNGYLDGHQGPLSSVDVSVMLALLKVARIAKSPDHIDNWADLAGYAACGGELAANSRDDGPAQPDQEEA